MPYEFVDLDEHTREFMVEEIDTATLEGNIFFSHRLNPPGRRGGPLHMSGRAPPPEQAQQVLVFGEGLGVNVAILITRAFGIRNLKHLTALPPAGEAAASWEQVRYRDAVGGAFTELDLRELARSPAFAAIGV